LNIWRVDFPADYVLAYQAPDKANERIQEVLNRKRESELTPKEAVEVNQGLEFEELVSRLNILTLKA
jgi:hypothetical protein